MISVSVDKNELTVENLELITSGSVNTNTIKFTFSADWDGLKKVAVFQTKKVSIPVDILEDTILIPWEAMYFPNEEIRLGVCGTRLDDEETADVNEEVVLPTIWGSIGKVTQGALITTPPVTAPTKDSFLQLLDYIKNLKPGTGGGDGKPGVDGYSPTVMYSVDLLVTGWGEDNTQSVVLDGVLADESKQLIQVTPRALDQIVYYNSGILAIEQGDNSLKFKADKLPEKDLSVYVAVTNVSFIGPEAASV